MVDKDFVVEFGSFQEVLDGYASQLSEEGIFFETTGDQAVGSALAFEVRIRGSFSVLRGEGEIVQVTEDGVFLRLVHLDKPSLKLLPKLLEHYRRRGVPLLELPDPPPTKEVEPLADNVVEPEDLAAAQVDSAPEETAESVPAASLTLDDLEAEFLADSDEQEELAAETDVEPEEVLVEVSDTDTEPETAEEVEDELDEIEAEIAAPLADPVELISEAVAIEEVSDSEDIHLGELLTEESTEAVEAEAEAEAVSAEADLAEDLPIDSGLPWLPDEPEGKGRKDLWVIFGLIVIGAALGAAFYFFFLRPKATSSWRPAAPAAVQAQVLPASSSKVASTPLPVETKQPTPELESEEVSQSPLSNEPAVVEPLPRSHDPPVDVLTRVDRITWGKEAGQTVITFWGDGLFVDEQVDDFRVLGGAPREVVRIRGIRRPFPEQRIQLDTDHVLQIRVGLHEEANGSALHFVADLTDPEVEILRTEASGGQLRVYFARAG